MLEFLNKLLEFLEKRMPWLLLGYHLSKGKITLLEKEVQLLKLEIKNRDDEKNIRDYNDNLTDDELRADIVSRRRPN